MSRAVPSIHNHILFQRHGYGLNLSRQFPNYREHPNVCNSYGTTPLHVLSLADFGAEIAEELIKSGAQLNALNISKCTPLHFAVIHRNQWMIDLLIEHGADVNLQDVKGNTALHFAIKNSKTLLYHPEYQFGDLQIIRKLLNNGADIDVVNKDNETALMWAIIENHLDIVKELLAFGANVNIRNIGLETCLHLASRNAKLNSEIIIELVKHGACMNCLDQDGKTVLEVFLHSRNADPGFKCAKTLIKFATLMNSGHEIDLRVENEFVLKEFIRKCSEEVLRMKSIHYADKFSLCHFSLGKYNTELLEDSIFDKILETLLKCNYPIYLDFIVANFRRSYLCKKLVKLDIYAKNERCDTSVYLNHDVITEISSYLSERDLFNFMTAYLKPAEPLGYTEAKLPILTNA